MEILRIVNNILYAVKYSGQEYDEYNRIFEDHGDLANVRAFFESYKWEIDDFYVTELSLDREEVEAYSQRLVKEALDLEERLEDLIDNCIDKKIPGLSSHFKLLEGFETEKMPALKGYGLPKISMLRVYAIELARDQLIIFYSGIKIGHKIKDCPILRDNVIQKAKDVISFLKEKGIFSVEDLNNFLAEKET